MRSTSAAIGDRAGGGGGDEAGELCATAVEVADAATDAIAAAAAAAAADATAAIADEEDDDEEEADARASSRDACGVTDATAGGGDSTAFWPLLRLALSLILAFFALTCDFRGCAGSNDCRCCGCFKWYCLSRSAQPRFRPASGSHVEPTGRHRVER